MPAFLLLLLLLLTPADEAVAHASLRASSPPDGASLAEPPERIELRFSEPVVPLSLALERAEGATVAARLEREGDGSRLLLVPVEALDRGAYLVRWRVVSIDGHPVAGRLAFAIGAIPEPTAASDGQPSVPLLLARALHIASLVTGAGAVMALLLLPLGPEARARTTRLARAFLLASAVAALVRFAVTGLEASGLPTVALLGLEPWSAALATGVHRALATTTAGCLLLAFVINRGAPPPLPAGFGLLLAAGGFGLGGHTATAPPAALFAPALVLHVALAMAWLGALAPLLLSLRHDPPAIAQAVLERFSDRALAGVPILLAVGAVLAMRQLPDGSGLVETLWGRILLLKLGVLAGLLAIGGVNRLRLVPAFAAGEPRAGPRLRRLLAIDLALGFALIAATAGLGTTPPPRLVTGTPGKTIRLADGAIATRLQIVPAMAGWNRIAVQLEPPAPPPLEVRLRLVAEDGAGEPLETVARPGPDGTHRTDPLLLVPAGTWRLSVGVLLDPFTRVELEGRLALAGADHPSPDPNRSGEPR